MKKIPLSKGITRPSKHHGLYALVDDADYKWLSQWNWTAVLTMRKCGGYAMRSEYGQTILMHRIIMDAKEGEEIDHIDGRGLNNQRANLRFATRSQGLANRGRFKNNKTGLKGVIKTRDGKWKMIFSSKFDTPEEAAMAYDKVAKIIFGEFARPNYPDG